MKTYILLAGVLFSLLSCGSDTETYTVESTTLYEGVYASGEIAPDEYQYIRSLSTDRIYRITVRAGDTVIPGKPLVIMGVPGDEQQLLLAGELVSIALKNTREDETILNELKGQIELARQTWQQDSLDAYRYSVLAKNQSVAQIEADKAATKALTSKSRYEGLKQQYQTLRRDLQHKAILAQQEQARIRQTYANKLLMSEINGIVYSVDRSEGELVSPDQTILMIGTADQYKLELLVDERDIAELQLGQTVYFETDAFPNQRFEARIAKINPVLQKETRSFAVEARVLSSARFYPQASVEANILLREKKNTILIPEDCLFSENTVKVRTGDDFAERTIRTGTIRKGMVEVEKGLSAGDVLLKNESADQ